MGRVKNRQVLLFFVTALVCLLVGYSLGMVTTQYKLTNVAAIKAIGVNVYLDPNGTQPVTHINWGILEPASSKVFKVYVQSLSNVPSMLTVSSTNWQPTNCTEYMTFIAEPNNVTLQPSQIIEINLTLTVASEIQGITDFSFDIIFEGFG